MFSDQTNKKSLCFTYILLLSALCLSQSAFATITVTAGGGQQVSAGSDSQDIVFKVLDEQGNPNTGTTINFTLIGPQGNTITDGLSNNTATPDGNDGLVTTRLNGTGTIGNYAITARQATDSTQSATTNVIVIAGNAAKLTVISGDNQTITVGQVSGNLTFQLTDAFNNAVAGEDINFTVRTPTGDTSSSGLSFSTATTDSNGEVTTRLENTETKGNYTVIATRAADTTMTADTLITVTDARPELPSLGLGMTLEATGALTEANAIFNGGTKVNDGEFQQEVVLTTNDSVLIQSEITVDSAHIGQAADILVVAYYNPIAAFDAGGQYFMIDNRNVVLVWDGNPASLVSFISVNQLPAKQFVNMYGGILPAGQIRAYVGYRLNSGVVIFNGNQTINARIKE